MKIAAMQAGVFWGRGASPDCFSVSRVVRFVLIGLLFCGVSRGRAELANGIKAVVHDSVVTYVDVEELSAQTEDVLRRQFHDQPEVFARKMQEADSENLEKLLANELILHDFKTAGYNLPESYIDEAVQDRIKSRFGDRMTATRTLQARGITYEKFREQIRDQIIIQAMREKNISSSIIISPHKVEAFYLAHRDEPEFKMEDQVKLRMIVRNRSYDTNAPDAHKMAEEIENKLKEGTSFAEMAKVYSQGWQKNQGDWVERSVLRKELADVAFSLKPGQRSEIIETPDACYIMLVEDTRSAHYKPLAEVRDQIEKSLILQEQKRLEKQWIGRLRKKTFVQYF
jgi:parvulin-like peptidyl-prolyl isomerase